MEVEQTITEKIIADHDYLYTGKEQLFITQIKNEIKLGTINGLTESDICLYLKPGFTPRMMQVIRVALEEGIPTDYVDTNMALEGSTTEQMLKAKIEYYQSTKAEIAIPGVYVQSVESMFLQLREQVEKHEKFFEHHLQGLKKELKEEREQNRTLEHQVQELKVKIMENNTRITLLQKEKKEYAKSTEQSVDLKPLVLQQDPPSTPAKESKAEVAAPSGKEKKSIFPFKRLKAAKPKDTAWLIELLCNEKLTLSQCEAIKEAYAEGIDKEIIQQFAKPEISVEKMNTIANVMGVDLKQKEESVENVLIPYLPKEPIEREEKSQSSIKEQEPIIDNYDETDYETEGCDDCATW